MDLQSCGRWETECRSSDALGRGAKAEIEPLSVAHPSSSTIFLDTLEVTVWEPTDDPASLWRLRLHLLDGKLRRQKARPDVGRHHAVKERDGRVLDEGIRGGHAGVLRGSSRAMVIRERKIWMSGSDSH